MRRSFLALVLLLLGLTVLPAGSPASASCAAPYLKDTPAELVRGDQVTVEGRAFVDGCQDTGSCPAYGCGECDYGPPETPYDDVELRLQQGGRTWLLDTEDAGSADDNQLGHVTWTFTVPDDVRPGRARLITDQGDAARVRIRPTAG